MTAPRPAPFRAGRMPGANPLHIAATPGPSVLLADVSEFEPSIADAAYLAWSQAIVIRAAYGAQHDDRAWYGGQRRALLHQGGARFLGIYQYLVAGQDGAAQADVFAGLVGKLQPGEVLIADFEEGQHAMLTAWYNRMLSHGYPQRFLWTYAGLNFGQANGALPVEWIAAYGQAEPASPHKLWQFTDAFQVPGVGLADCSVFHGTIDQLAALACAAPAPVIIGPPRNVAVTPGDTTVKVTRCDPPQGMAADHYKVWVYRGSYPHDSDLMATYPRTMERVPQQFGSLQGIPPGGHMTLRVRAYDAAGNESAYADVHFAMP